MIKFGEINIDDKIKITTDGSLNIEYNKMKAKKVKDEEAQKLVYFDTNGTLIMEANKNGGITIKNIKLNENSTDMDIIKRLENRITELECEVSALLAELGRTRRQRV